MMNVSEIMSREVKIVSPDDTLTQAAQIMKEIDAGVVPVGENDRLVGMLTDRDITIRAVAEGKSPDQCLVRDVMSPAILYVFDDTSVDEAARNMGELQVRRLPVVNHDKRLVGILSLGDIAINRTKSANSALNQVSQHH